MKPNKEDKYIENKEDKYIEQFIGADYTLFMPSTIGELKETLDAIIKDLPEDNSLKIYEFYMREENKIGYLLEGGEFRRRFSEFREGSKKVRRVFED